MYSDAVAFKIRSRTSYVIDKKLRKPFTLFLFFSTSVYFRVKKRFPTIDHVIEAGLMKSEELKCMEALNDKYSGSKWWMPLVWATNIVVRARQENKIKSDPGVQTLLSELSRIRHGLTKVQHYDTLSVPLVYTQVYTNSMANLRFLGPKS